MKNRLNGYTLVELLVVITIMALLGAAVFINSQTYGQDQILSRAIGQVQSGLRLAQNNATAGLICIDADNEAHGVVKWSARFDFDKTKVSIYCEQSNQSQKTFQLEDTEIISIKGDKCSETSSPPVVVTYTALYGILTFTTGDLATKDCLEVSNALTFTLKNLKNGHLKNFNFSKGGAIDVQ